MNTSFKSRIDFNLFFLVFGVLISAGTLMVFLKAWVGFAIIILLMTFIIHLLFTTRYRIVGQTLNIRSGIVVNKTVDVNSIKRITETNNFTSSPANSLDRIELHYNQFDRIIISPKDKAGLIKSLTELNPYIEVMINIDSDFE